MPHDLSKPARRLPVSLIRNARAKKILSTAALLAQATDDIALIKEKQKQIADAFYDIGQALTRLSDPKVLEALGRPFASVCATVKLSVTSAKQLIAIVAHLKRVDALRWGEEKSGAVVDLARALGDGAEFAVDKPAIAKVLPNGATIDSIGGRELKRIAKTVRHRRQKSAPKSHPRGRTTTPTERDLADALETAIRRRGFRQVRIEAKASKPGSPAKFAVTEIPASHLAEIFSLLSRAAKRS